MRIGVVGAMVEEINHLQKEMEIVKEEVIGMRSYYSGILYGQEVVLVFSRYGKVASASTVTTLIERYQVDFIIFTGVAGAVSKELKIGDIVIADKLVQHDMDVSALSPDVGKYFIPLINKDYFEVDEKYVSLAKASAESYIEKSMRRDVSMELLKEFHIDNPKVVIGTIASGDLFVADSGKIKELSDGIDNLKCVEMEGAAVAQVCYEHQIPCIIVRVMSDNADEHADVNFQRFIENTASHFTRGVIVELISKLQKI